MVNAQVEVVGQGLVAVWCCRGRCCRRGCGRAGRCDHGSCDLFATLGWDCSPDRLRVCLKSGFLIPGGPAEALAAVLLVAGTRLAAPVAMLSM